ncbi:DUF1322 family protein [Borrelia puertoricensis]|uniref:DUF1322 family protein n=1 Tax=Borrelia puertoricensis TaxID=2756107 RepID=UPI001FF0FB9D|nr:DUF1322 family protein [Borrelia puertoricensis]UPA18389.1 DUF1322 family protein [Borrelia puertoricensis]UPA18653.1 DUF1322 family protein [Borrelia puertoricensis]
MKHIDKFVESINATRTRYFALIDDIKRHKYWLPIITGICSYREIKCMTYDEFIEVSKIAEAKIEKEILELILSK